MKIGPQIDFLHMQVDESLKVEEVEIYYDPAELIGGLLAGTKTGGDNTNTSPTSQGCPLSK